MTCPTRMARGAGSAAAGMTLLEVMIAAGIMATALVLLMGSLGNISATGATAEDRALAASHVSSVLEEIRVMDRESLLFYRAPGFRGLRGEALAVQYVSTTGTVVNLPLSVGVLPPPMPNPAEIRVTATWQSAAGHPYRYRATTLYRW
jgi:type II secretory pathway pseudopilin PulG